MKIFFITLLGFLILFINQAYSDNYDAERTIINARVEQAIRLIEAKDYDKFVAQLIDPKRLQQYKEKNPSHDPIKIYKNYSPILLIIFKDIKARKLSLDFINDYYATYRDTIRIENISRISFHKRNNIWYLAE